MDVIRSIYSLQKKTKAHSLAMVFPDSSEIYYYSLARWALFSFLQKVGIKDFTVLVPEFICRDILGAIHLAGGSVLFYPVNECLSSLWSVQEMPKADFILGVNFFGFSCDVNFFKEYAKLNNSIFIEDNAHGFLGQDADGNYFGMRGDVGIFSFRKTFAIPGGGGLWVKRGAFNGVLFDRLESNKKNHLLLSPKHNLKLLTPFLPKTVWSKATIYFRKLRKLFKGQEIPLGDPASENTISGQAEYSFATVLMLDAYDFCAEVERRRKLYNYVDDLMKNIGFHSIWQELPAGCSPYGYAFRAKDEEYEQIQKTLFAYGLETITWPDLPSALDLKACPPHYREIRIVRFLW